MKRILTGRKSSGWLALLTILLFNVICFALVDTRHFKANGVGDTEGDEPFVSKTAKRVPKFARVTEVVLGQ